MKKGIGVSKGKNMQCNKGRNYDKMVILSRDDELGLFEKYEEVLQMVRDRINKYNCTSVIDFGCGTGNLCGPLSNDIEVIGIDRSIDMINTGKSKFHSMRFIEGDFIDLQRLNKSADIVVSSYVLHGLTNNEKEQAISYMMKLSKRGRIILVDFMFESNEEKENYRDTFIKGNKRELWDFISGKNYFIVEKLKESIENRGLKINTEHIVNFTWIVEIYK
ncbi:MAG: class I SAM-dependent methyltransferase [Clostridium sp.]|uniref:class I SAM-dependent methyltransferase n=1 Tax=Clostridium sp. TaxID=1506 RepID=UPI003043AE4F